MTTPTTKDLALQVIDLTAQLETLRLEVMEDRPFDDVPAGMAIPQLTGKQPTRSRDHTVAITGLSLSAITAISLCTVFLAFAARI